MREALKISPLDRAQLLAGAGGLGREISSIAVMDDPEVDVWIRPHDFVLTSGFFLKDSPHVLIDLVRALHARNVAALGLNLQRWVKELPEEAIRVADELQLPVLLLPAGQRWLDLMTQIMNEVFARNDRLVHGRFVQAALSAGIAGIVNEIGRMLHRPVAVYDADRRMTSFADPTGLFDQSLAARWFLTNPDQETLWGEISSWLTSVRRVAEPVGEAAVLLAPLRNGEEHAGVLLVWEGHDPLDQDNMTVLEHGATMLTVELQKQRSLRELERRYREEFLMDLLFGHYKSMDELTSRAKLYGLDLTGGWHVAVTDLDSPVQKGRIRPDLRERIIDVAVRFVRSYTVQCAWVSLNDSVVLLMAASPGPDRRSMALKLVDDLRSEIRRVLNGAEVAVGVGSFAADPTHISRSFDEARQALAMGKLLWGAERAFLFEDLGVYRLILSGRSSEELIRYKNDALGPLIGPDEMLNNLLDTLEKFLDCNNSVAPTASKLFVHANTVKYRVARIRDLLKVDLDANDVRLKLLVALKIRRMERHGMLDGTH